MDRSEVLKLAKIGVIARLASWFADVEDIESVWRALEKEVLLAASKLSELNAAIEVECDSAHVARISESMNAALEASDKSVEG
jgi:uncharacterized Zn finger protein